MANSLLSEPKQTYPSQEVGFETYKDHAEQSRRELAGAIDMFVLARGANIAEGAESGSLALASVKPIPIKEGRTKEELQTQGFNSMVHSYQLLEYVDSKEGETRKKPACTVCVPVAILQEDQASVLKTIDLIHAAQINWGQPVEIVLWANAGYEQEEERSATNQIAREHYESLRQQLVDRASDELQIQTALEVLPKNNPYLEILTINEAAMSRIRSHYMDAISLEALERGYDFEHPVIWIDADTTFMSANALQELSDSVRSFEALLVHANLQYSMDWATGQNFASLDDATKAVAINEIHRRQLNRDNPETLADGYMEESGLAFALGSYLRAGGINTSFLIPLEESAELRKRMHLRSFQHYTQQGVIPATLSPPSGEFSFGPPLTKYIASARIGTSARRQREAVEEYGLNILTHGYKGGYELFTNMKNGQNTAQPQRHIPASEMRELFEHNEGTAHKEQQQSASQVAQRARGIYSVISKYFEK